MIALGQSETGEPTGLLAHTVYDLPHFVKAHSIGNAGYDAHQRAIQTSLPRADMHPLDTGPGFWAFPMLWHGEGLDPDPWNDEEPHIGPWRDRGDVLMRFIYVPDGMSVDEARKPIGI